MSYSAQNNPSGVYRLDFPSGDFYVGASSQIRRRVADHRRMLRARTHGSGPLQSAFDEHQDFIWRPLIVCRPEDLDLYEQACFDALKPNLNCSLVVGRVRHSKDGLRRISEKNSLKRHTEEWKADNAKRMFGNQRALGHRHSEETRARMSASSTGKPKSPEHRAKLAAHLRRVAEARNL